MKQVCLLTSWLLVCIHCRTSSERVCLQLSIKRQVVYLREALALH